MRVSVWLKAATLWLVILVLAILNGTLREKALIPMLGDVSGLVASGVTLSLCVFIVAFAAAPRYGRMTSRQWILVGLFWLGLTLAFEFGFGLFVQHKSPGALLAAYTFRGGNLWPVVLAVTFLSPWLAAKLRRRTGSL